MDKAKPIEPGCLALTYNCLVSQNNGKIVKILRYIGDDFSFAKSARKDRWEIDLIIIDTWGGKNTSISVNKLLRIDDPSIQSQIEEENTVIVDV